MCSSCHWSKDITCDDFNGQCDAVRIILEECLSGDCLVSDSPWGAYLIMLSDVEGPAHCGQLDSIIPWVGSLRD